MELKIGVMTDKSGESLQGREKPYALPSSWLDSGARQNQSDV
jgi:hypothetical protein